MPELNSMFLKLDEAGKNAVRASLITEYARNANLDKAATVKLMNEILTNQ